MARTLCEKCQRPIKTCFCHLVQKTPNKTLVVILQHPTEVKQAKGSATLLDLSLQYSKIIVGENFNDNAELLAILEQYKNKIAVLYPSEIAQEPTKCNTNIECLLILDATWKKSYKMFQLSTVLHDLPHFKLPDGYQSLYQIRKTNKDNALSTLEACCHALSLIESNSKTYQPVIESFVEFNRQLMSFR